MLGLCILFLDYHLNNNINKSDPFSHFFEVFAIRKELTLSVKKQKNITFLVLFSYLRIDFNHVLDFFTFRKTFAYLNPTPLFLNSFFY